MVTDMDTDRDRDRYTERDRDAVNGVLKIPLMSHQKKSTNNCIKISSVKEITAKK
jgi:hypothetical protein